MTRDGDLADDDLMTEVGGYLVSDVFIEMSRTLTGAGLRVTLDGAGVTRYVRSTGDWQEDLRRWLDAVFGAETVH